MYTSAGRRGVYAVVACALVLVLAGTVQAAEIFVWDFANPPAQGPSIKQLLDDHGGQMQVGDKIFSFFNDSVTTAATINTVAPDAAAITLSGIQVLGDYGLRFNGGWSAGGMEIANTTILFKVEIAEPELSQGWVIHDNSLWISAFGVSNTGQGGIVSVSENVYAQNPRELPPNVNPPLVNKFVYYRSDQDMELMDHQVFDPLPAIWVLKDVTANGGILSTGVAHLSEFHQTFSQVPEPATAGLLALGGVSMVLAGLRRRRLRA